VHAVYTRERDSANYACLPVTKWSFLGCHIGVWGGKNLDALNLESKSAHSHGISVLDCIVLFCSELYRVTDNWSSYPYRIPRCNYTTIENAFRYPYRNSALQLHSCSSATMTRWKMHSHPMRSHPGNRRPSHTTAEMQSNTL